MMEFSTCQAEVYSYMNDPDHEYLTENEVADWLNLANLDVAVMTRCLWNYALLSTDGTALINLSTGLSDFIVPLQVFYDGERIKHISIEELMNVNWRWPSRTGTPENYYLRGHYMGFYPYETSAGSNNVGIHYLEKPDVMVANNSQPLNGVSRFEPLHSLVVLKACLRACLKMKDQQKYQLIKVNFDERWQEVAYLLEDPAQGEVSEISVEGHLMY